MSLTLVIITMRGCAPCNFFKENARTQLKEMANVSKVSVAEIEMSEDGRTILSDTSRNEHLYMLSLPQLGFPMICLITKEATLRIKDMKASGGDISTEFGRRGGMCVFNRKDDTLASVATPVRPSLAAITPWFNSSKRLLELGGSTQETMFSAAPTTYSTKYDSCPPTVLSIVQRKMN